MIKTSVFVLKKFKEKYLIGPQKPFMDIPTQKIQKAGDVRAKRARKFEQGISGECSKPPSRGSREQSPLRKIC